MLAEVVLSDVDHEARIAGQADSLERAGYMMREPRKEAPRIEPTPVEMNRDKQAAAQRSAQMHAQRWRLRDIGAQLLGE